MIFEDKIVLITGGSSGIGLALAQQLANQGAILWIIARDENKLTKSKELINPISKTPKKNLFLSIDITDYKKYSDQISVLNEQELFPDIVINSAGVTYPGEFLEIEIEKFDWLMKTNYFGTLNTIKLCLPKMVENKSGHIINISSIAGFIGVYGYTGYSASKFALRGLTDTLRAEFKSKGILFSLVFPPDTQTPQLEYEDAFKPDITRELAGTAKAMSAEAVATSIIKGIRNKKYLIFPGSESLIMFHLTNFLGKAFYPIMDLLIRNARKSISKNLKK